MALNKHLGQPKNLLLVGVRGGEVDDPRTGRSCLIVVAGQRNRRHVGPALIDLRLQLVGKAVLHST